jgi:tRNA-dihydrouridine synthase A
MLKSAIVQEDETVNKQIPHISVAPMMDWTDRHCRYFHRLLSPNVRLYTEMVTTGAILHGDVDRHLRFNKEEHELALQLGGSDANDLKECVKIASDYGYDEINLNCGCPSERVQKGAFGACLMAEPDTVARCVEAMADSVSVPVTVKCRISIDDNDPYPFLKAFMKPVADAGCGMFILHARAAWLKGLSPKENREVPPLDYNLPARMKKEFPHLKIILNGGIKTVEQVKGFIGPSPASPLAQHPLPEGRGKIKMPQKALSLQGEGLGEGRKFFDGVMIGREAYQNPGLLLELEREIYGNPSPFSEMEVVERMIPYIEKQAMDYGTPVKSITRHMIGLFQGKRGSKAWRRILSTEAHLENTTPQFLEKALEKIKDAA